MINLDWHQLLLDLFVYQPEAPLLFNSYAFLILYAVVLAVYAPLRHNRLGRTIFLFCFSLFFYYKSSGLYVFLLIASLLVVYGLVRVMSRNEGRRRKWWLAAVIVAVIGTLGYFKYTNFLVENLCALAGREFKPMSIFLPIGISFYSFQLISYAVDVYRREVEDEKNFLDYAFYITFFPQLVAGPIVRARNFLPQLKRDITIRSTEVEKGFFLIMQGLVKKAVFADYLAQYNDLVFANPTGYSGFETLMAVLGYAIQIYCDFSGYTDMAIGMGKMMGFDLGINFNKPYQSTSLSDFWHRWHISLSTWLRDYIYIPLGGNRRGKVRTYINLMLTMLIGGLWHGSDWKFIFWGGMHGVGLVVDKAWNKIVHPRPTRIGRFLGWLLTLAFVVALWVFFRAESFGTAIQVLKQIFIGGNWAIAGAFLQERWLFAVILLAAIAIHAVPSGKFPLIEHMYIRTPFLVKAVAFLILLQLVLQLQSTDVHPFIYFQF